MTILFWTCIFLIFWAYVGYPASMYLLAKFRPARHEVMSNLTPPTITVIIAVANGADKIYDKLLNTFSVDYPLRIMNVIVVMDGHCIATESEIKRFDEEHPESSTSLQWRSVIKGGKEKAQLAAVREATGDVCVFTDVGTTLQKDAFHMLTRHFQDFNIGAVDGISTVITEGHSNEGLYLRYEGKIREWESQTTGLVGTGGCLFAARTSVIQEDYELYDMGGFLTPYPGFSDEQQSDFRTALVAKTAGKRTLLDTDAVAGFADGKPEREYLRKHRTVVRGLHTLLNNTHLLNPYRYGLFSYALFCHKVLKWMVPWLMVWAYVATAVLAVASTAWAYVFILYTVGLILSLIKFENKLGKILNFAVMSNLAIGHAWISYIKGERYFSWEPTKR